MGLVAITVNPHLRKQPTVKAQDIKPGVAVDFDGQVYIVVKSDSVKPGKGPAYSQVKLKNIQTGKHVEKRLTSGENVNDIAVDKREMEFLYEESAGAVFMDSENFEQVTVPHDVLGEALSYIKPNATLTALYYQGQVLAVDLPATVDLEVSDTPPGIKGATATNQLKEATLETGLKTRVPPFIAPGDVVRVNTESGEYVSRQNA